MKDKTKANALMSVLNFGELIEKKNWKVILSNYKQKKNKKGQTLLKRVSING